MQYADGIGGGSGSREYAKIANNYYRDGSGYPQADNNWPINPSGN